MAGAKKSTWVGSTVFAGIVISAGAYFFAISPAMAATADLRDQTEQTISANEITQAKVDKLKADSAKLDQYKAELAAIQQQIPTSEQLSAYLLELDATAVAHSVTLSSIAPSAPTVLAPPVAAAPPVVDDGTGTSTPADESATATADPAAPVASPVPAGLVAIPFSITVVGSYDNTLAFLWDIQNSTKRLLLVTGVSATAKTETEAGGGMPALADGDQELVITGQTYVLPDAPGTPAADPAGVPAPLPGAVPGKNPLVSIAAQ